MEKIKELLELMAQHGGEIVCTASLRPEDINQAREAGRMYVDENSIGFIWEPNITRMPETDEEIEFFDKWYPLQVELPEGLKDASFLWECKGAKCRIPNCKVCKNEMY